MTSEVARGDEDINFHEMKYDLKVIQGHEGLLLC